MMTHPCLTSPSCVKMRHLCKNMQHLCNIIRLHKKLDKRSVGEKILLWCNKISTVKSSTGPRFVRLSNVAA